MLTAMRNMIGQSDALHKSAADFGMKFQKFATSAAKVFKTTSSSSSSASGQKKITFQTTSSSSCSVKKATPEKQNPEKQKPTKPIKSAAAVTTTILKPKLKDVSKTKIVKSCQKKCGAKK